MKHLAVLAAATLLPGAVQAQDAPATKHPPVFWNKIEGTYSVNVRSVGDGACALDFIDLANERLVNLLQDAKTREHTVSLIVGDFGAAAAGSEATLGFTTTGKTATSFEAAGTVRNADEVLQTIVAPLSGEQARAILSAERITASGRGKTVLEMAIPTALRQQAQLKFLDCVLTRM